VALEDFALAHRGLVHPLAVDGAGGHGATAAEDQLDGQPHEADQEQDQADRLDRDAADATGRPS